MSKIEQLLKKLCPNGVEYKKLGEVAHYSANRIDASCVNAKTYVGVESLLADKQGKVDSACVPVVGRLIEFLAGDVLIGNIRPYLKKIWLADCDGGTNGDVLAVQINDRAVLMPEYLYYVLSSDSFFLYDMQFAKGAKMPRGDKESILGYLIPVPPLEIQREVVEVLDKFALLTAELTAELEKRKKQYEHYRDKLLNFTGTFEWLTLGDTCVITTGKLNANAMKIDGEYPFFTCSDTVSRIDVWAFDCEALLVAGNGNIGETKHYVGKFNAYQRTYVLHSFSSSIMVRFLYHVLRHGLKAYVKQYSKDGTLPYITLPVLSNYSIPLPPLAEQERIVKILDRFDKLCNDLTSGLPAEIAARKKQYEYYRDKLLSFKRAG